jgi:hypothetical protein
MRTVIITSRENLPDEACAVAAHIEDLGFKWTYDSRYPTPDPSRRIQIRDEQHYAPKQQVKQYAAAMQRGDNFPPGVATADGYAVDGNTRIEAARENKYPTIEMFILDREYENASEQVQQTIYLLAAVLNSTHGNGLEENEIRRAIISAARRDRFDAKRITAFLRLPPDYVNNILNEKYAEDRAQVNGIQVSDQLHPTKLRLLGRAKRLYDKPWSELFLLTQDSGLSAHDLRRLIKAVENAGSEEVQLDLVATDRMERRDQIAEYRATGKARVPISGQLRRSLGFVIGFEANPRELVEHNRALAESHQVALERALKVLTLALAFQKAA